MGAFRLFSYPEDLGASYFPFKVMIQNSATPGVMLNVCNIITLKTVSGR